MHNELFGQSAGIISGSNTVERAYPESWDSSARMVATVSLARRAARSDMNILLLGETGVGKDLMANAIHRFSKRNTGPFLALNCAGLDDQLAESQLFGHVRGAFTGAVDLHKGYFEAADGGTLFMDEVGELSPSVQAKLLRAIESREIVRVGSVRPQLVNARVISATNRPIGTDRPDSTFRRDLYFRFNGISISIPPLRERRDEVPAIARTIVDQAARSREPAGVPTLDDDAMTWLQEYDWPGNIRELRNILEAAVALGDTDRIRRIDLVALSGHRIAEQDESFSHPDTMKTEADRIRATLGACGGNQGRAAQLLGMSRRTLITRLERYQIPRPRGGRNTVLGVSLPRSSQIRQRQEAFS